MFFLGIFLLDQMQSETHIFAIISSTARRKQGSLYSQQVGLSRESTIAKSNHTYQMPQIIQSAQLKSITPQNYSLQFVRRPTSPGMTPKLQTVMCSSPPMSLIPGLMWMMLLQNSTIISFSKPQ
jgi:hypothetical protein